ncbi:MAG: homocysteine S-methyltransferase family protein [Oscillospiraceae bacterium]|nr:homocysteine S-methyltransferase family protein [Oscillospiraceae bacterium]
MPQPDLTLLDGAMGTMLLAAGLPAGAAPELMNLRAPEAVTAIHRAYVDAGSRVLYTNSFGANRRKLAGTGHGVAEVIAAAVRCARAAAAADTRVALDLGPIGQLLEPLGTLPFDEAYDIYREAVEAGAAAGADLIVFETLSDLAEARAAVLAAKEHTPLPVWVTMTFEATGRSFLGVTPETMGMTLRGLGVDALGFNCSLGPAELVPLVRRLREWTGDLPLILKPNAGLPDPRTGEYRLSPEDFAAALAPAAALGVRYFGGCCGTRPEFIAALRDALRPLPIEPVTRRSGVCCASAFVETDRVRAVGERINPTGKKKLQAALRSEDLDYVVKLALEQQDAGAEILDVNVGLPGGDEAKLMAAAVRAIQESVDLPLQLDSANPAALEAGLRLYQGKALVNSVSAKAESLKTVLPLCKKYGAALVCLCLDDKGLPSDWRQRVALAKTIRDAALELGIPETDLFVDCLTLTVSAQPEQARETLRAVRVVTEELGLKTTLGVSNIAFGMPQREALTAAFLSEALSAGLTLPIVNPLNALVMDALAAHRLLSGQDPGGEAYLARFTDRPAAAAAAPASAPIEMTVEDAILRGLKNETAALIAAALEAAPPLEVVERLLIPALDEAGRRYETGALYLPQLIKAAAAAGAGFERVRERIAADGAGSVDGPKIILATVRGDIHDIGKNIVRAVLENYGYRVIDLGRDVPPEAVVEAARRERAKLVGLSALMTTTLPAMAETIRALRAAALDCRVMVGGAVLTPDYAREVGADYYARDAKASADVAREVFGR